MANEKPGGHGDRAHGAGALDMADDVRFVSHN